MRARALLVAASLCVAAGAAGAPPQAVYRCGNVYAQQPCGPGAQALDVRDERSDAQHAEAWQAQQRHQAAAQQLERERRRIEAEPVAAGGIHGVPPCAQPDAQDDQPPRKPRRKKRFKSQRQAQAAAVPTAGLQGR